MNCENIKKGDQVNIYFESIFEISITRRTVKKVNKKTFVLENGSKYWKVDGKSVNYSPFTKNYITKIIKTL